MVLFIYSDGGINLNFKNAILAVITVVLILIFAGCSNPNVIIVDGTYRAEFDTFDSSGYKDFVEVTFKDGLAVSVSADAVKADGTLKSMDNGLRDAMSGVINTYPEKYYRDLINQYIANPDSDGIDVVAGATESSNNFIELLKAVEKAVVNGEPGTVTVKR